MHLSAQGVTIVRFSTSQYVYWADVSTEIGFETHLHTGEKCNLDEQHNRITTVAGCRLDCVNRPMDLAAFYITVSAVVYATTRQSRDTRS